MLEVLWQIHHEFCPKALTVERGTQAYICGTIKRPSKVLCSQVLYSLAKTVSHKAYD